MLTAKEMDPLPLRPYWGVFVNGSCGDLKGNLSDDCHVATANKISVESLELLLENQYKHDFNERDAEDKEEMSREDTRFIEIMEQSVKFQDGHYSLKLPFKTKKLMSNNRCVAQQLLVGIGKKGKVQC